MPWFITAIYNQKTATRLLEKMPEHDPKYLPPSPKTLGFFNTYTEASNAVAESVSHDVYSNVVIEYIEPGIYPMAHASYWWVWNPVTDQWEYSSSGAPPEFRSMNKWALR